MNKILKTSMLALAAFPLIAAANSANDEVTKLVRAKLPDSVIIAKINELGPELDTSADTLIGLKEAGASDAVLDSLAQQTTLSSKSVPPVPLPKNTKAVHPVIFKFNRVEFRSLKIVQNEVLVTIGLVNNGNITHEFYSGNSTSATPAPASCEQALLSDNLGNSLKCKSASLPLLGTTHYARKAGASAQPGDMVLVTYVFERPAGQGGSSFSFSANAVARFMHEGFIPNGTPLWGDLTVEFDDLTSASHAA